MASLTIIKNKAYEFTVYVKEEDSFTAQDLTDFSSSTMTIISYAAVPETIGTISLTVLDSANGVLKGTIPATITGLMASVRGDEVDGFYLKPAYQGLLSIVFSGDTTDRNVLIDKIYVTPGA